MRNLTENEKRAKIFKSFCDPNRLTILDLLRDGEKCACELLDKLQIGQPTLSHHMKILCDAGIVAGRKEGKWTYYSFDPQGVETAAKLFAEITAYNADNPRYSSCRN